MNHDEVELWHLVVPQDADRRIRQWLRLRVLRSCSSDLHDELRHDGRRR